MCYCISDMCCCVSEMMDMYEYHSLLCLLCPDFPLSIVQQTVRCDAWSRRYTTCLMTTNTTVHWLLMTHDVSRCFENVPSPVWLSGNGLFSINVVTLCRIQLVPGWMTVLGQVNHLSTDPGTQVYSAWAIPPWIGKQEVKVIWQKAPHGGPIPRLGVTPGGRNLYHWIPGVGFPWIPGVGFPISVP